MNEHNQDWLDSIEILGHWGEAGLVAADALVAWAEHLEGDS